MAAAGANGAHDRRSAGQLELVTAVLLGLAGVATSWSGYQVARWNGSMTSHYDEADAQRLASTRAHSTGALVRTIDVGLFTNWLNAYAARDSVLARFYRERFRREFRPVFDAWIATHPQRNEHAPGTPFAMKQYRPAVDDSARVHDAAALRALQRARRANQHGDDYSLVTVLFATVLFLAGTAGTFRSPRLRLSVVLMAGLLFAGVAIRIFRLPVL